LRKLLKTKVRFNLTSGAERVKMGKRRENTMICILCKTSIDTPSVRYVDGEPAHPEGFCEGDEPKTIYTPLPER